MFENNVFVAQESWALANAFGWELAQRQPQKRSKCGTNTADYFGKESVPSGKLT